MARQEDLTRGKGDLIRLKSFTTTLDDGVTELGFKAGRNKVFVAVLLGVEPKTIESESDALNIEAILNSMGWVKKK